MRNLKNKKMLIILKIYHIWKPIALNVGRSLMVGVINMNADIVGDIFALIIGYLKPMIAQEIQNAHQVDLERYIMVMVR